QPLGRRAGIVGRLPVRRPPHRPPRQLHQGPALLGRERLARASGQGAGAPSPRGGGDRRRRSSGGRRGGRRAASPAGARPPPRRRSPWALPMKTVLIVKIPRGSRRGSE